MYIYTHSVFDGCIILRDIHGEPFLISEGDEITFNIIKADNDGNFSDIFTLSLSCQDEVEEKYPLKILPETTSNLYGLYYYNVTLHFADGDIYTIVPFTKLHALLPFNCIGYHEHKNDIVGIVPRVMAKSGYIPFTDKLAEFISDFQSENTFISVEGIQEKVILFVRNFQSGVSTEELIQNIKNTAENYGTEVYYVTGFFYDNIDNYHSVMKNAFGKYFIDVQKILKTPVFENTSDKIISSIAFDQLNQTPSVTDILSIEHGEYPDCILLDETHFNDKGLHLVARTILQEVNAIELQS